MKINRRGLGFQLTAVYFFYMIDYITSILRTGSNARQVCTTNSKIKKLLPISHRILSHTARANKISRKKQADSTGWLCHAATFAAAKALAHSASAMRSMCSAHQSISSFL